MGKHDKKEEQQLEFKWEPPKDDFYKARIERLKSENKDLRSANAKMKQLDKCVEILGNNYTDKVNEKYTLRSSLRTCRNSMQKHWVTSRNLSRQNSTLNARSKSTNQRS